MSQASLIFNRILNSSITQGASYIHLESGNKPTLRIAGRLKGLEDESVVDGDFITEIVKIILSADQQEELEKNKSIIVVHNFEGGMRFKINIFYQKSSLAMIFKYLPAEIKKLVDLGLTDQFIKLLNKKKGLILVTGQHGSGKASTSASMLNHINTNASRYIITIENPIQYIIPPSKSIIDQREVGKDTLSFEKAISFAEESDADIVFLSEVNNAKSLEKAIDLIDSGRLVIAVVEAPSAADSIEHLINLVADTERSKHRQIISNLLLGTLVQRLIPRRGGGQIVVLELLIANPAVSSLIKEGKHAQLSSIIQTSRDEGMRTLDQSLIELVHTGEVDAKDALPVATDKIGFQAAVQE